MRKFDSGAIRDTEDGKYDFEGCLDPAVLREFAGYMYRHSFLPDGTRRSADNWQKGFGLDVLMKSLMRHVMDLWLLHRGHPVTRPEDGHVVTVPDALGGLFFNTQGYWSEYLKENA